MKKLLTVLLTLSMLGVLSACSDGESSVKEDAGSTTEVVETTEAAVADTFAGHMYNEFKNIVTENPDMTTEQIAEKLSQNEKIQFSSMFMPVEEGFLQGFTTEISGFKSGAVFGPAMSSIAVIGYVFEAEDENAAKTLAETLKSNADMRWLICVEAEETICEVQGNKVFFMMAPFNMSE